MISENLTAFYGKPVRDFAPGDQGWDFAGTVPRFRLDFDSDENLAEMIGAFASLPGAEATDAIVVGSWVSDVGESSQEIVEALVAYKDRFPDLRALFLGDIISEENEISWINQSDLSALWPAFPHLEHVQLRGGTGLSLGRLASDRLTTLIIESGGLPLRVVREALAADLPNLRHLELWLGSENYGSDSAVAHFEDLLAGRLFPKLRTLGLRDCEYADALAAALARAPLLERIDTLDLSLGNLTDEGAEALAASPLVARLQRLDLHHHFLGDAMMARLAGLGPEVDLSDRQQAEEYGGEVYRSIAVSE